MEGQPITKVGIGVAVMKDGKMPKHYVDIGVIADWKSGEPHVLEPEKCEGWDWYSLDNLPMPLFAVEPQYIEAIKTGRHYFGTA